MHGSSLNTLATLLSSCLSSLSNGRIWSFVRLVVTHSSSRECAITHWLSASFLRRLLLAPSLTRLAWTRVSGCTLSSMRFSFIFIYLEITFRFSIGSIGGLLHYHFLSWFSSTTRYAKWSCEIIPAAGLKKKLTIRSLAILFYKTYVRE